MIAAGCGRDKRADLASGTVAGKAGQGAPIGTGPPPGRRGATGPGAGLRGVAGPGNDGSGGVWAPSRRLLTSGLVLAVTLVAFEALAVATVMPVVSRHLGDLALYGWVFSAFALSSLVGIVVAGTLADRAPLWPTMLAGLVAFAGGLVVGGAAPSMPVLVVGRAVQGLGAGVVPAVAYVAISRGYPDAIRPRMFAVLSTAWVVPGLVGPVVAAGVAGAFGWRWVFLGLLPIVAVAGLLACLALRSMEEPAHPGPTPVQLFAVLGVVLGAGGALVALDSGSVAAAVPGFVAGAAVVAVFLRRLTPAGTLTARPGLPATILSRGLLTFFFYAGDAYVPYAVTTVRHQPTFLAGAVLTTATVAWTVGSWVQARTIHRVGPRRLVRTGEVLVIAGLLAMGAVALTGVAVVVAVAAWGWAGLGMGLAYAPLSITTLDRAPAGGVGRATSGLQLTDVLGQGLGTGAAGALVAAGAGAGGLGPRVGVGLAFALGATVGVVALVVALRLPDRLLAGRSPEAGVASGAGGPG